MTPQIWTPDEHVITSLLDADFYKFTMGQFVFRRYPDVRARSALICRTKGVRLAETVREADLRRELDHARTLRFTRSELHYLRGTNEYEERMFKEDYLTFLHDFQLPPYELTYHDGESFTLEFSEFWRIQMYWETIALAIVNELHYRTLLSRMSSAERDEIAKRAVAVLRAKIAMLREHPNVRFSEFGTRRRFSRVWQWEVDRILAEQLPAAQFLGTSNTRTAMDFGLLPMGTSAHELFMAMACIMDADDDDVRASHNTVLQEWWEQYGWGLSIALPDTWGTEFFFRDFTSRQARQWKGSRQDSGDPIAYGERLLQFYARCRVDAREKMLIPSDGLDLPCMLRIADHFRGRIGLSFGWGTNLTNDCGLDPLSLVVKLVEVNGHPCVKLSDNPAKAMGPRSEVERYQRIFGYRAQEAKECRY